jgi:hypothetical protein
MWEARAAEGRTDDLAAWALAHLPDGAEATVYRSVGEDRVVVVATWHAGEPRDLPEPPGDLVARPPHAWDFVAVAP